MTDKRFAAEVAIKARGDAGQVEAVFSTATVVDSVGDRVLSSAFKDGQAVPMVWAHDWSRPVGRGVVKVEPTRAVFAGRFFTETTAGKDAYLTVKAMGELQEWSFGFQTIDSEIAPTGEQVIKSVELFEVSPVLIGANRATATLAIKRAATASARPALPPAPRSTGRYLVVTGVVHVDREVRRAAQEAADLCADDLGIKRRDVCWFDDATPALLFRIERNGGEPERFDAGDDDGCLGVFRPEMPNCIFVKVTNDPRLAAEVAAHETRHRWQVLTRGKPQSSEMELLEADAKRYSDDFVAWMDEQRSVTSW